jgi:hypothetical protein
VTFTLKGTRFFTYLCSFLHLLSSPDEGNSINEQLKRFEILKQKLESPELQKEINYNSDKLRRQNRLIHLEILRGLVDKMELLIIDAEMINALGYKMYIEHLISLVQHL